jgi:hypothetical protein
MNLKIGEINKLVVKRISDLGYMLENDEEEEVLLHFKQALKELEIGDTVNVFLFFDSKRRITATCEKPFITVNHPGFVKINDSLEGLGLFINNNIIKDHLISQDDLPVNRKVWPIIGDTVLCKLKATSTQLIAKLLSINEAKDLFKPEKALKKGDKVTAIVLKIGYDGINFITLEGHNIFVHYKQKRKDYRIGEEASITINNVGENNNYNGTLLEAKVPLMENDAEIILRYLKSKNGVMNFTTASDVRGIEKTFNMSKAAFKRALGNLYKKRIIEFKDNKTYLVK